MHLYFECRDLVAQLGVCGADNRCTQTSTLRRQGSKAAVQHGILCRVIPADADRSVVKRLPAGRTFYHYIVFYLKHPVYGSFAVRLPHFAVLCKCGQPSARTKTEASSIMAPLIGKSESEREKRSVLSSISVNVHAYFSPA